MKKLINIITLIVLVSVANLLAQDKDYLNEPGYVNFGNLTILEDGEMVTEIIIEEKLLRMVAKFTNDDEELSSLIGGLKLIRVNTFEVTEKNQADLISKANSIDKDLMNNNWDRIVKTKSRGEVVNVYIKTKGDEEFSGLTVVTIDNSGEATFVNIVGTINMDAIGKLGNKFDIPGLDNVYKDEKKQDK